MIQFVITSLLIFFLGTLVWPDGHAYEGMWKEDKRHGKGKQIFPSGNNI